MPATHHPSPLAARALAVAATGLLLLRGAGAFVVTHRGAAPAAARAQRAAASGVTMMSWRPNKNYNSFAADEATLSRSERGARSAGAGDRLIELRKPLGVVLEEDGEKNCFIASIEPGGNADQSGEVAVGDVVTMCSATFGDQMWSCRGVGLNRVLRAIKVRSGLTVSLVVVSKGKVKSRVSGLFKKEKKESEAKAAVSAAEKRKQLEDEVLDERKSAAKGWFGLF